MIVEYRANGKTSETMAETKHMLFAKNLICVCADEAVDGDYNGRIFHQYDDEPVSYRGLSDMLVKIEELLDHWDFPQRGLAERKFKKASRDNDVIAKSYKPGDDRLPIEIVAEANGVRNVQNNKGTLGTFIIQVVYRQEASWQGHVIYQEANEQTDFRSALELIKYMDGVLSGEQ
jgi:hypothetical protein